jgi:hypothetical protein
LHALRTFLAVLVLAAGTAVAAGSEHPRLLLTPQQVRHIRAGLDAAPGFTASLAATRQRVDAYFRTMPDVPVPQDPGGGYTHEQHKKNGIAIHDAGILYQLTGEASYAQDARALLLAYADLYPALGEHPQAKSNYPGRLFWQGLNESVWLVYAIQGYDAIYDTLSASDRNRIEQQLLRRMADFLSVGSARNFDRIHNHATWAAAAVGMTGYVLGDEEYVRRTLYGLKGDGSAGFLKQLDLLFSPDGYYTEGPYYQRYALMPFVVFGRAIEANEPERDIFGYRDGVLLKAIVACIDESYAGLFFPINDAIKDKGLDTIELRYGLAIAYAQTGDRSLLSIAERQKSFALTADGFATAKAIDAGLARPYEYRSVLLRDGHDGRSGALAVLRSGSGPRHSALVFKATAQGMGHGHFDKLSWLFYDNGHEIVTDYGAARFLNVEQKEGGRYLPENESWAKQTIAHNTLVADGRSHFDADLDVAERYHPDRVFFDRAENVQVTGAAMEGAYEGVRFERTLALLGGVTGNRPLVLDVLRVASDEAHRYDLPLHFSGQVIAASPSLEGHTDRLTPLGDGNGYQHLWLRARARVGAGDTFALTWLKGNRFYTWTALAPGDGEVLFTELGANDPHFNLRREQALILRVPEAEASTFVSVLEPHGEYNGAEEYTVRSQSAIASLEHFSESASDLIHITTGNGDERWFALSWDPRPDQRHSLTARGRTFEWNGYYRLFGEEE